MKEYILKSDAIAYFHRLMEEGYQDPEASEEFKNGFDEGLLEGLSVVINAKTIQLSDDVLNEE